MSHDGIIRYDGKISNILYISFVSLDGIAARDGKISVPCICEGCPCEDNSQGSFIFEKKDNLWNKNKHD